ncbi:MAG TPA: hypothetical protein VFO50_06580 [Candidatus Limnocylindrales bacterium]|nr:hypothetical protein [Candidatus Limnocylindrales bacterium]
MVRSASCRAPRSHPAKIVILGGTGVVSAGVQTSLGAYIGT